MQADGAVDNTEDSTAEKSRLVNKKTRTEEAEVSPARNTASSSSSSFLGNLLVVPMDGSHWIGIKAIAEEMGRRGHRVTVLIPEISIRLGPGKYYDTVVYPVPYDQAYLDSVMSSHTDILKKETESITERIKTRFSQFQKISNFIHITAEGLLFNDTLIARLAQQDFDAMLTDPFLPTGSLVARKLGEFWYTGIISMLFSMDMTATGCPSPPSYVPRFFTGYTDQMNFKERIVNTLVSYYRKIHMGGGGDNEMKEECVLLCKMIMSTLWAFDFTLDFPRPLMPNIVLVGGINCDVRNPLPEDLESWVSGEHGFVVFTLGTMVSDMPEEITSIFLEVFRQIPQKVIWRYTGQVTSSIPENVKMMKWVPQNDLLAHSGARAFITHAGSHGLFEGLCHAVPMVMLPLGGDQHDNAMRFVNKGVGVVLDIFSITTEILLQGLNQVLHDIRYKENVLKLSALHKDRPVDPLDLSVYWTEYVMRHKGTEHLKPAVHELNWIQYLCLDVIALIVTVVLTSCFLTIKCIKLCYRKLSKKRKQD
uniref:UDP-glucuronosyltransferase n=1 Tax=Echeneis naucrates TaxID=173247 RepID=A0A665TZE4_ECHNA